MGKLATCAVITLLPMSPFLTTIGQHMLVLCSFVCISCHFTHGKCGMLNLVFFFPPPQNLLFWLASTEQTGYVASARHTFGYPVHHTKFRNLWLKASSTLCVTPNISLKFSKICSIQLKRKRQQIQKHATIYLRLALHQSRTPEIENHCNCN